MLSCSHAFHKNCIASLEHFAGKRVCPVCREEQYQVRIVFEATNNFKIKCATRYIVIIVSDIALNIFVLFHRIQSVWRGYQQRKKYIEVRRRIPPKHPVLRKKFFENKLSEITDHFIASDAPDVNSFLSEMDRSMAEARRIFQQFDSNKTVTQTKFSAPGDWEEVIESALNRGDDTCPICLSQMGICDNSPLADKNNWTKGRSVTLLSCSHLFHTSCLSSLELFASEISSNESSCPLCRHTNYDKITMEQLFLQ